MARAKKPPTQAYHSIKWRCLCDCGQTVEVFGQSLRSSRTLSCGCLRREQASKNIKKAQAANAIDHPKPGLRHGRSKTPEWFVWVDMRKRCTNPKAFAFDRYGGRGITFCDRWAKFENFFEDMGERPSKRHTLERKDNDGNYEPDNCRWATWEEQARNRSNNHHVTAGGFTRTIAEWAESHGLRQGTIWMRLNHRGWSPERAVGLK